jgi:hypothetical protein
LIVQFWQLSCPFCWTSSLIVTHVLPIERFFAVLQEGGKVCWSLCQQFHNCCCNIQSFEHVDKRLSKKRSRLSRSKSTKGLWVGAVLVSLFLSACLDAPRGFIVPSLGSVWHV